MFDIIEVVNNSFSVVSSYDNIDEAIQEARKLNQVKAKGVPLNESFDPIPSTLCQLEQPYIYYIVNPDSIPFNLPQ